MNALNQVLELAGGPVKLTRELNKRIDKPVTYQAVMKWIRQGHLPRTDWTGETQYARALSAAVGGRVKVRDLLEKPAARATRELAQSSPKYAQVAIHSVAEVA
jgi:hypothetical protein